jgi:hypothetical protein
VVGDCAKESVIWAAELYPSSMRRTVNWITGYEIQGAFDFGFNRDNRGGGDVWHASSCGGVCDSVQCCRPTRTSRTWPGFGQGHE